MLLFHQVAIYSVDNSFANIDLLKELTNIYRFFSCFGKIVDFNLEKFPKVFYITFAKHSSVLTILNMGNFFINY